jgi:hypothetical protein
MALQFVVLLVPVVVWNLPEDADWHSLLGDVIFAWAHVGWAGQAALGVGEFELGLIEVVVDRVRGRLHEL